MSKYARAGGALLGAAAIVLAVAAPAAAEPATGKVDDSKNVIGYQVNIGDDWLSNLPTSLIGFKLADGTELGVYCVELKTEIDDLNDMVERPWEDYPNAKSPFNKNRAKINWVLHHGFPALSLEDMAKQIPNAHDGIDTLEAIAATQSAVWHFSDGTDLNHEDPLTGGAADANAKADVLALYDFLTGDKNTGLDEPAAAALKIDPADRDGQSGTRIGPFKVSTNATDKELKADLPDGVRVTDADGNELAADAIKDGTELFLDVPAGTADGDGKFELSALSSLATGRLFVGKDYANRPTQSLIVAAAKNTTITAAASAKWTTAPVTTTTETTTETTTAPETTTSTTTAAPVPQADNSDLASTGASVFTPILIGLVLLGGGIGALLFLRRRKA
jgi:TQXA domain-containing protein/LPXTG-motif cell wall-anchored protein